MGTEQPPIATAGLSPRRRRVAVRLGVLAALGATLVFAVSASAAQLHRTGVTQHPVAIVNGGQPLIVEPRHRHDGRHGSQASTSKRNPSSKHAPTITTQPGNVTVAVGALATFTAAASGNPTPGAQWQRSPNRGKTWSDVSGANSSSYSFVTTAAETGYWYRAMYINALGRVYTKAGTLTVTAGTNVAPSVTTQPIGQTVVKGSVVSFTAAASGYPAPTIQWQDSSNGGTTWAAISGATVTLYQLTAAVADNGYEYRAVFTNGSGSVTSSAATLTVTNGAVSTTGAPAVTTDPVDDTANDGGTASFTAAASGNPTPTVQWQSSSNGGGTWTPVTGATAATYDFTVTSSENGYEYRAIFTNSDGSVDTTGATLTVADESSNWSGYAITGGVFSSVSGDWTVPAVNCPPSTTTFSSQWIGIDGDTSDTVEQDGTEVDCESGTPYYGAWYEMYGDASVDGGYEVPLDEDVQPGDAMSATVSLTGSTWTLAIADATQDWHFSTAIPNPDPAPTQSSAEWIGERPEVCSSSCGLATLSDFGSFTFTNATATDATETNQPIAAFDYTPLEMVGSTVLAAPSPLSANGEQFTDTWDASS